MSNHRKFTPRGSFLQCVFACEHYESVKSGRTGGVVVLVLQSVLESETRFATYEYKLQLFPHQETAFRLDEHRERREKEE